MKLNNTWKCIALTLALTSCGDSTVTHELDYSEEPPIIEVEFPETPIVVRHEFDFTELVVGFINECEDQYSDVLDEALREQLVNACITEKIKLLMDELNSINEEE